MTPAVFDITYRDHRIRVAITEDHGGTHVSVPVEALREFVHAPRSEHLAVRLNDAELAAVEKMRAILARVEGRQ